MHVVVHPPPPPPFLLVLPTDSSTISLPCANILHGQYRYTNDLLALASAVAPKPKPATQWPRYHTPIQLSLLQPYLDAHPGQSYAAYIAQGLKDGFRIGFDYRCRQLKPCRKNHPTCLAKPSVVTERVAAELAAGLLLGPIRPQAPPTYAREPHGPSSKDPHQTNKFRLIVDLSAPASGMQCQ